MTFTVVLGLRSVTVNQHTKYVGQSFYAFAIRQTRRRYHRLLGCPVLCSVRPVRYCYHNIQRSRSQQAYVCGGEGIHVDSGASKFIF